MKKNKIAFTMIELIVVTIIIILLTTTSVFYFFDFTDNRELLTHIDILEDNIDDLDAQIKNFEISDYELYFTQNQLYYTGSINNLGTDYIMSFTLGSNMQGDFSIIGGDPNLAWNYTIYEGEKNILNKITTSGTAQIFDFRSGFTYIISGYVDGIATNTIFIDYVAPIDSGLGLFGVSGDGIFENKNNQKTPLI